MFASNQATKKPKIAILLFCAIIINAVAIAQSTPIPDSSFEQVLIDFNIDTNGLNGSILNSDAEAVETLNIFNKNITDLTGIEAFVNLKHLYCYFNNVESLNLEGNTLLETLDIENNSISELNISQNVNLKQIYIGNNLLNELDVSNNTNLEVLSCSLNNISELDITNNMSLEVLWCYSNNLTEMNLSNNVMLESFFCGDNQLSNLNISNNSLLESISCSGNAIQNLNVSHCLGLKYLDLSGNNITSLELDSNTDLRRLLCSENIISSLDLSNNPDLLLFYASNNQLSELDLVNNSDLRFIRLHDNNLIGLDIRNGNNENISEFNAFNNPALTCVFVDIATTQFLSSWNIDVVTNFVENQEQCNLLNNDEEVVDIDFEMFPNPASGQVTINTRHNDTYLTIYNINGQVIQNLNLLQGKNNISLAQMNPGLYIVNVSSRNQFTVRKLIIR